MTAPSVSLVEVGPRDGFQSVKAFIPTAQKTEILLSLYGAGLRRIEVTSFVSERSVPQLADAREIVAVAATLPGLDAQVLVPNERHCVRALEAGAAHFAFVLSASETHNLSNVRRSHQESIAEYSAVAKLIPPRAPLRLNIATAFDCPFEGRIRKGQVLELLGTLIDIAPWAEIALCDTTGSASPADVEELFGLSMSSFPRIGAWAFHGHDTYGLGAANARAAHVAGVSIFDASVAGLGGCPFAPGATGNVATEDLAWMFAGMEIETGVDIDRLIEVASRVKAIPGAQTGGRVHDALTGASCVQ